MESHVNPQPDDPHIRLSHQLHREIIRRKFTARQRSIMDFILTLSWGCGKPSAIIPKLKDFSLCGVRPNHIRKELLELSVANVIFWDGAMNAFQLNKHYDQWNIEIVDDFDKKSMDQLISYNIEIKSPNLSKRLPEKGSNFPKEEAEELPESGTNFPKREAVTSQKGNFSLPKKGSRIVKIPHKIKAYRSSKESIKASLKKRTNTTTSKPPIIQLVKAYSELHKKLEFHINGEERTLMFDLIAKMPVELIINTMNQVHKERSAKTNITSFLYYRSPILQAWEAMQAIKEKSAGPLPDFKNERSTVVPIAPQMSKKQRELAELRRKGREERQRGQSGSY